MERIYIKEAKKQQAGKEITLSGWVHEIRDQSKIKFILLRDMTGIMQIIAFNTNEFFDKISKLPRESVVEIKGIIKDTKQAPGGKELELQTLNILAESNPELPIPVIEKGDQKTVLAKRLDYRSIDLRKPKNLAIFKIQSALIQGMQKCLNEKGFIQVFTPCIMGVPSESGSEVFEIRYFNDKAFLRQDPQLHRQLTILGGIEKLYDIGPCWRAEKSHTVRHLCEHRVCAAEFAFLKDEKDTMDLEEDVIISAIKNVKENCQEELDLLEIQIEIPKKPFPVLNFPELYDILKEKGKDIYGEDLDIDAERIMWDYVKEKYNCDFYFFNGFPNDIKPFYVMMGEKGWAKSVDLNFRGTEISSGGQRENRYEYLLKNVKDKGMKPGEVEWFTKFFKYGAPPHGGFAIGIERITMVLLGISNVRDCTLFPRDPERNSP